MSFEQSFGANGCGGTFLSIPIYSQLEIVNSGKKIIEETLEILKGKAETEGKESSRLAQLAKKPRNAWGIYENLNTTMTGALYGFRNYISENSELHMNLSNNIREHILSKMENSITRENDTIHRQRQLYEQASKQVNNCENTLNRAKKHLDRMKNEVDECKRRLELALSKPPPFEGSANPNPFNIAEKLGLMYEDPQKWRFKLYKAEESVRSAQQDLVVAKSNLASAYAQLDQTVMECAQVFQTAERERINEVKSALEKIVVLEGEYLGSRKACLHQLAVHVQAIDAALDQQNLVKASRSPDNTHRYGKALELLDWDFDRHAAKKKHLEAVEGPKEGTNNRIGEEKKDSLREASEAKERLVKQMEDMKVWLDNLLPAASGENQKTVDSDAKQTEKAMVRIGWLVREKAEREGFLTLLNQKRSERTEVPEQTFVPLAKVGHAFLDACYKQKDVASAKQLMIMANTFYRVRNSEELEPSDDFEPEHEDEATVDPETEKPGAFQEEPGAIVASGKQSPALAKRELALETLDDSLNESPPPKDNPKMPVQRRLTEDLHRSRVRCREYLQSPLKAHEIWSSLQFWEDALFLGVQEQFDAFTEPLMWDELCEDARRDAVLRVHNIVYSELASTAFNMVEFGVQKRIIKNFVDEKSASSQLCEDQVMQLNKSIANIIEDREKQEQLNKQNSYSTKTS